MTDEASDERSRVLTLDTYMESLQPLLNLYMSRQADSLCALYDREPSAEAIAASKERTTVYERVYSGGRYENDSIPEKLTDVPKWCARHLASVPRKYRSTARLEIDDDEGCVTLTVSYGRPETDAEWDVRRANMERRVKLWADRRDEAELKRAEVFIGSVRVRIPGDSGGQDHDR